MDVKQIILYLCICGVACFPSKPLNDRPSELAWQAWLLVDAQNPNEGDKRITPKSVFIAPNIGGDNGSGAVLPECAEGYRSDPMGRCIKFVKVDEAAHLDFLLQRLNAMYATRPTQDLDDDVRPTTGPLQVNIPLGGFPSLEEQKDPEIAIIVAPTNGNFDTEEEKEINKRTQDVQQDEPNTEEEITTTILPNTESTTSKEQTTTESLSDDLQALFFLVPLNKTDHVEKNRTSEVAHTTTAEPDTDNSTPIEEIDIQVKGKPDSASLVRFPTIRDTSSTMSSTIIFPDSGETFSPQEAHRLSSSEIEHLFKEYISQKPDIVALTSTDHITRRRPISEGSYFDTEDVVTQPQIQRPQQYFNPVYNHRNRDRSDFWRPASSWREETIQKPLVLRFNRPPYSQERSSYEDRQPEEFSQVFGRKRRRGTLR